MICIGQLLYPCSASGTVNSALLTGAIESSVGTSTVASESLWHHRDCGAFHPRAFSAARDLITLLVLPTSVEQPPAPTSALSRREHGAPELIPGTGDCSTDKRQTGSPVVGEGFPDLAPFPGPSGLTDGSKGYPFLHGILKRTRPWSQSHHYPSYIPLDLSVGPPAGTWPGGQWPVKVQWLYWNLWGFPPVPGPRSSCSYSDLALGDVIVAEEEEEGPFLLPSPPCRPLTPPPQMKLAQD